MQHPDEFFYLNQGDSAEIEGLMGNDEKEFEATREAFKVMTWSLENIIHVFRILGRVLCFYWNFQQSLFI